MCVKALRFVYVLVCVEAVMMGTAYAYLDPGTGSMILQVLAASALVIGIGWRFIISFIRKLFKREAPPADKNGEKDT